jgi:hypothetical protein
MSDAKELIETERVSRELEQGLSLEGIINKIGLLKKQAEKNLTQAWVFLGSGSTAGVGGLILTEFTANSEKILDKVGHYAGEAAIFISLPLLAGGIAGFVDSQLDRKKAQEWSDSVVIALAMQETSNMDKPNV